MFKLDPVKVLDADPLEWLVRVATFNIIAEDKKRERDAAKRRTK